MQVPRTAVATCLGLVFLMFSGPAQAQYQLTNLVSNQLGQAPTIDPLLANPWGLARSAGGVWWISDNDTGWSTLYNAAGTESSLKVSIPTAGNGPSSPTGGNGPGQPTGIVFNGSSTDFQVWGKSAPFIYATLDGTISAWAPGYNANQSWIAVDNSANNASYTGLAATGNPPGNFSTPPETTNKGGDGNATTFIWVRHSAIRRRLQRWPSSASRTSTAWFITPMPYPALALEAWWTFSLKTAPL